MNQTACAPGACLTGTESCGPVRPTVRVRLWLETDQGLFVGLGRAQLLANIAAYGSLKKAAERMGMSYRAAWGKLRESERVLGFQLVVRRGCRRDGQALTPLGALLMERYLAWFKAVEAHAVATARKIFSLPVKAYAEKSGEDHRDRPGLANML